MRTPVLLALCALFITAVVGADAKAAATSSISANITSFKNNDPVTVTVSTSAPTVSDVVALYLVGANRSAVQPIKYKWLNQLKTYNKTGKGVLNFNLLNQRVDVQFFYYTNVSASSPFLNATVLATGDVITNAAPNAPEHGHLALTNVTSEMIIQWTTHNASGPMAMYGTSNTSLGTMATGSSKTYNISALCGAPATTDGWVPPGTLHVATMTNLKPDTRYFYQYGSDGEMSPVYSFLTAPPVGPDSTVSFIAIADLGHTEIDGSREYDYDPSGDYLNLIADDTPLQVVQAVGELITDNAYQQAGSRHTTDAIYADMKASGFNYSLFLLNGDVSYARGMQTQWDVFMDQLQPIATRMPWMLTQGNHERDFNNSGDRFNNVTYSGNYDSGGECGVVYNNRFQMPEAPGNQSVEGGYNIRDGASGPFHGSGNTKPEWYSYNYGPIHFTVYNTELDFSAGSPQYAFIEADLKAVNRSETPWLILNGHRPIYTTNTGGASPYGVIPVARDLRLALEPLLFTYGVDLTLHGHDHIYERTCPIYNNTCLNFDENGTALAPVHVVIGNAGYELSWFANPFAPQFWKNIAIEHGYIRCKASSTKLLCQEISSFTGKQLDQIMLTKPEGWTLNTTARAAQAAGFNSTYVQSTTLESIGIPGGPYGKIIAPLLTDLSENTLLLKEIIADNRLNNRSADYATEHPDTVVDDCNVLKPAIQIIENMVIQSATIDPKAAVIAITEILPQYKMVCAVADHYASGGGVVRPYNAKPKMPTPLAEAFYKTMPRPAGPPMTAPAPAPAAKTSAPTGAKAPAPSIKAAAPGSSNVTAAKAT